MASIPEHIKEITTCINYRKLREDEVQILDAELKRFDKEHTKITAGEQDKKKSRLGLFV